MRIEILSDAEDDLITGFTFYERQCVGVGDYFLNSLYSDIDSLLVYAGIHQTVFGYYRALSKRFPYSIYYRLDQPAKLVQVHRVLDCRRNPRWIKKQLGGK
jgi:plasmid stabilization system protein ParE